MHFNLNLFHSRMGRVPVILLLDKNQDNNLESRNLILEISTSLKWKWNRKTSRVLLSLMEIKFYGPCQTEFGSVTLCWAITWRTRDPWSHFCSRTSLANGQNGQKSDIFHLGNGFYLQFGVEWAPYRLLLIIFRNWPLLTIYSGQSCSKWPKIRFFIS